MEAPGLGPVKRSKAVIDWLSTVQLPRPKILLFDYSSAVMAAPAFLNSWAVPPCLPIAGCITAE
jgi:hypothetical protein